MSAVSRYRSRLEAALAEMQAANLTCNSPLFHVARALGLPLRPTFYLGLVAGTVHYAAMVVPLVGLALWLLVWRHDEVRPMSLISPVLQVAALPSAALALLTWLVARWKRLSRWHELDGVAADAGLPS